MRAIVLLFLFFASTDVFSRQQTGERELHFTSSLSEAGEAFADSKRLLEKVCYQYGLVCSLAAYPSGRAIKMLQDGETAGELPRFEEFQNMAPTAVRVPAALGQLSFSVLTHDKAFIVKTMNDLSGHKVFYVRGNAAIALHKDAGQMIAVNSEQDCASMVLRKLGDACIITRSMARKILEASHQAADTYFLQDLFSKPVYIYLSPRYKYLQEPFDQILRHVRAEEKIAQ
ncbi:transporter substrate-binding domain-containing protein [Undibacterium sp. CY18W]|uniref:Transporter substrate-binding domain-containing protein n=1 Tax=Undibacterium hunanense TaxID=2762292 RepID=A0ABR6ZSK0_9BURK|nr:transporter substrate-binding domain-containing protein [Undibacterium hunanense]MBC3918850.1 transporter substrate-binding domain-containing protein [Undibacterium hunanense]